jgi:putative ATP-dependent endonuclease of OLD family
MKAWEVEHPDRCVPIEREAQFIGPTTIGVGSLDSYTKFVFIPAVRDVGDETADGKGSALSALLALVVNERIEARPDLAALKTQLADRYLEIFGPNNQPELRTLEAELTNTLSSFHPGSQVRLDWGNAQAPTIPLPAVVSSLVEDGFAGHVSRKGHGLQRALILSLLQTRASLGRRAGQQVEEAAGGQATSQRLILAIEEPELYQHPQQCRHWAGVLRRMTTATTNGEAPHTQVIFTTHSPHFVDLAWFDQVRVVRKSAGGTDLPQVARISSASIAEVGRELADAAAVPLERVTDRSTRARSRPVMTSMVNEGFFSGVAVLVEGGTEVGLLAAIARHLALGWDSKGISVIDIGGKTKLDKPLVIFRRLGIPTYVVFDGDAHKNDREDIQRNRLLLGLLGARIEDYPATSCCPTHAVMRENSEIVLKSALPVGVYDTIAGAVAMELGYSGAAQAMKNVDCASLFVSRIYEAGHTLPVIEGIVETISGLAQPTAVLAPR